MHSSLYVDAMLCLNSARACFMWCELVHNYIAQSAYSFITGNSAPPSVTLWTHYRFLQLGFHQRVSPIFENGYGWYSFRLLHWQQRQIINIYVDSRYCLWCVQVRVKVNVNHLNNKKGKISWGPVNAKYVTMHRPSTSVQLASYHSMYVLHPHFAFVVTIHLLYYRDCYLGARIPKSTFSFQIEKTDTICRVSTDPLWYLLAAYPNICLNFSIEWFWTEILSLFLYIYELKCNRHSIFFVTSQKLYS